MRAAVLLKLNSFTDIFAQHLFRHQRASISHSGGFRDCGAQCRKHPGALVWKFLLTKTILQVVFCQNSNAWKLFRVSSYLKLIDKYLFADFSVESNLFYKENFPYWTHVNHVKRVLYINKLYRKKPSFHKLNNEKRCLFSAKIYLKYFAFKVKESQLIRQIHVIF